MSNRGFREVAQLLRDGIDARDWAPGTMLPAEVDLAATYMVSRTTVRRALQVLEQDRVVEVIPGRGRMVRAPDGETPGRNAT